ncbi:hypothetical protein AgCh_031707 [Apium graveolens]
MRRRMMTRKEEKKGEARKYKKPSLKVHYKSVGRKSKKAKHTEKVQVTERDIWNCYKQSDFLPLNWCNSDEDYFQQLAVGMVRAWVVTLREDKDAATRAWRSVLAEWLIVREERRARNKAEYEDRKRKYDEEIEMIDLLSGYLKPDRLKLVEALRGTPIIEELEILVYLNDLIREETKDTDRPSYLNVKGLGRLSENKRESV